MSRPRRRPLPPEAWSYCVICRKPVLHHIPIGWLANGIFPEYRFVKLDDGALLQPREDHLGHEFRCGEHVRRDECGLPVGMKSAKGTKRQERHAHGGSDGD
jgi:hypothetical protein